ncbi:MAG TPA: SH3 domain-containing protein, partial [Thermomicrobiales bacterium]|nr:SH3 domain-containing protein [Thermomicrobiales bacterium]
MGMQRRRGFGGGRLALTLAVAGIGWASAAAPPPASVRAAAAPTATIANAQDGVTLRAQPSYDAQVLGVVPDGANVDLRTATADTVVDPDGATRWWPVAADIGTGWVAGFFLQFPPGSPGAPVAAAVNEGVGGPSDGGALLQGGDAAIVDEPDGVNFRAQPGPDGQLIQPLKYDTVVGLRLDAADTVWIDGARWWPVDVNGLDGWIAGDYLAPYDDGNAGGQTAAQAAPPDTSSAAPDVPGKNATAAGYFAPGSYAAARTDDGSGVNVRADAAPDSEKVGGIPESDVIQIMDGPTTDPTGADWYQVTDGDLAGWVDAQFLQPANQPANGALGRILSPGAMAGAIGVATGVLGFPVQNYTLTQGFGCTPL